MATNKLREKSEVLDPLTMFHTVGQELENVFNAHGKDIALMEIPNIQTKEKLTKVQIKKACQLLGLDNFFADFLESFQNDYIRKKNDSKEKLKEAKASFRKLKSVIPLLRDEFNAGYDLLDDILDFFGVDNEEEINAHIRETCALYHSQNQTEVDEINLSGWIRRGELDYEKMGELPSYNKEKLKEWIDGRTWDEKLTSVSFFKTIPKILSEFGVCLVLLPYMQKTVYGAVKWKNGHPIIMISDREQDLATCWFTLFHEFGHVLLHENELAIDGMLNGNEPKGKTSQRERDANKFANMYLFNGDDLRKRIFELKRSNNYEPQTKLASYYNVKPLFVGYWMRKAQYYPAQYHRIPISFS